MAGLFETPEESEAIGSLCNLGTLAATPSLPAEVASATRITTSLLGRPGAGPDGGLACDGSTR